MTEAAERAVKSFYTLILYPFVITVSAIWLGMYGRFVGAWFGASVAGLVVLPLTHILNQILPYLPGFGLTEPNSTFLKVSALGWAMLSGAANGAMFFPSDEMGSARPFRLRITPIIAAATGPFIFCLIAAFKSPTWQWAILWAVAAAIAGGFWGAIVGDLLDTMIRRTTGLAEGEFQGIYAIDHLVDPRKKFVMQNSVYRMSVTKVLFLTLPLWLLAASADINRTWQIPLALSLVWILFRGLMDKPLRVTEEGVCIGANKMRWDEISFCQIDPDSYCLYFVPKSGKPPLIWKWFYASIRDQIALAYDLRSRIHDADAVKLIPSPIPRLERIQQDLRKADEHLANGHYSYAGALLRSAANMALRLDAKDLFVESKIKEAGLCFATGALGLAFEIADSARKTAEELGNKNLMAKCLLNQYRLMVTLSPDTLGSITDTLRDIEMQDINNSPDVASTLVELRSLSLLFGESKKGIEQIAVDLKKSSSIEEQAVLRRIRGEILLRRADLTNGALSQTDEVLASSRKTYLSALADFQWLLQETRLGKRSDTVAYGWCLYCANDQRKGRSILEKVISESKDSSDLYGESLALWRMALISISQGEWEAAYSRLRSACDRVESIRWSSREDWQKMGLWAGQRQQIYEDMISLCLKMPAPVAAVLGFEGTERALEYVERTKSRALLDLLKIGPQESTASKASNTGKAYSPALLNSFGEVDLASIREALPPNGAILEYYQAREQWGVFLIDKEECKYWRLTPQDGSDLSSTVAGMKNMLSWGHFSDIAVIKAVAIRLYNMLWPAILRDKDKNYDVLYIVPHGILHGLPFVALYDGRDWLLRNTPPIAYGPSASILAQVWGGTLPSEPQFVGLAYPSEPLLSKVVPEVLACSELYDGAITSPSNGDHSFPTRMDFERLAPAADILHIATHGHISPDLLKCGFDVCGQNGKPELLNTRDILSIRLKARIVIASICHGAGGKLVSGDEWLGLLRAFVVAGAHTIIAPRWEIADEVSHIAMHQIHSSLHRYGIAKAIREAALKIAGNLKFEHPYYWSSLDVWGDGGMAWDKAARSETNPETVK